MKITNHYSPWKISNGAENFVLLALQYSASEVILMTLLHGPNRKHRFQQYLCCCMRIRYRGNVFTNRCLESDVASEPLASNGSFSGSTVHALSKCATILLRFMQRALKGK
jgi:hypothetical protein